MAIVTTKDKMTLKLELDAGIVDGKQKTQSKALGNIKTNATDEGLHATAFALAALQSKDLLKVKRIEETTLTEE